MNEFINIDSWMDVVDHLWIGLVLVTVTAIPSWFSARNHRGINEIRTQNEAIKGQVINGHAEAPPLRQDLDRVISSLDALGKDVRGLRSDLTAEGNIRRQQFGELRSDLDYRTGKHRRQEH